MEEQRKQELLAYLVDCLVHERVAHGEPLFGRLQQLVAEGAAKSATTEQRWLAFRGLVNTRQPWPAGDALLEAQDELLQRLIAEAGITPVESSAASPLDPRLRLWRGDITTLAADAIVNAANDGMTGCWAPLHYCIDNAIHTFAGIQLRLECARIMREQGHPEPTGQAKVTPAYNLPSKYVIHTVGPIANGYVTNELRQQLAASYRSCLDATEQTDCQSIAFCCISTGVFGFPANEAAPIALDTVRKWLAERDAASEPTPTVVFNVFSAEDEARYARLLELP